MCNTKVHKKTCLYVHMTWLYCVDDGDEGVVESRVQMTWIISMEAASPPASLITVHASLAL